MKSFPLEPIEKAGTDELRGLQLKRLQATLLEVAPRTGDDTQVARVLGAGAALLQEGGQPPLRVHGRHAAGVARY